MLSLRIPFGLLKRFKHNFILNSVGFFTQERCWNDRTLQILSGTAENGIGEYGKLPFKTVACTAGCVCGCACVSRS